LPLLSTSPDPRELPSFPTRRSSDLPARLVAESRGLIQAELERLYGRQGHKPQIEQQRRGQENHDHSPAHSRAPRIVVWLEVGGRSEEHTSELQSRENAVCRLLLEKK